MFFCLNVTWFPGCSRLFLIHPFAKSKDRHRALWKKLFLLNRKKLKTTLVNYNIFFNFWNVDGLYFTKQGNPLGSRMKSIFTVSHFWGQNWHISLDKPLQNLTILLHKKLLGYIITVSPYTSCTCVYITQPAQILWRHFKDVWY